MKTTQNIIIISAILVSIDLRYIQLGIDMILRSPDIEFEGDIGKDTE